MFVDIDGDRIGSLVNTVAHEGMHLNGAGEVNATITGYMTDLAYRANALANREAIDSHRPAPVAIQNPAAHQELLSGNQAVFAELEQRDDLEFRQAPIEAIEYLREDGRVERYMAQVNAALPEHEQLTREQALQEMDRGLAAFEDDDWASAHGRNEVFEQFLMQELEQDPAGTFTDNHGQTHALFEPTDESRADSQAGLRDLFTEYGKNEQVQDYVTNVHVDEEDAASQYLTGRNQGYEQAGHDNTVLGDAIAAAQGIWGLPGYVIESVRSNEVGPLDDIRMADYNERLLLLQGRQEDAGFIAGYTAHERDRASVYQLAGTGVVGVALNRALVHVGTPDVDGRAGPVAQSGSPELTIQDHNTHHRNTVNDLRTQLEDQGYRVSYRELSFGSSCDSGRCRPDLVFETTSGQWRAIEVKTGNADLSTRQGEIFPQIRSGDAIPRGRVADEFGLIPNVPLREQGHPNGIPVEIMQFPGAGQ